MTRHIDFLIIGGGLAAATAAETLRAEGAEGSILILSAEASLPYQRPPLSKRFLSGNLPVERILVLSEEAYHQRSIEVVLSTSAIAVDAEAQIVRTDRAGDFHYGKLLIATGVTPFSFDVPGKELSGIYVLHTVEDARVIKEAAANAKRAVVVGGSFIGMEVTSTLTAMGIHVTLLVASNRLFDKLESDDISGFFCECFRTKGIDIVFDDTIDTFVGKEKVQSVKTRSGKTLPCDFVVLGIGVKPCTDFLEGSGIAVNNGVVVDSRLQTNKPNIFAAGDVANFYDSIFRTNRRIEHWDNAVKQGRLVAKNMLGQRLIFDELPYFFCSVFDFSFEFLGDLTGADEQVTRGALRERSYALLYLKNDLPQALFSSGRSPQETKAVEALIRSRVNLRAIKRSLSKPDFSLDTIPAQTVLIMQGGGALGAFECGVVKAMEELDVRPAIVAGVSIGAFNGAIIASHPENATPVLEAFWKELSIPMPYYGNGQVGDALAASQILFFGAPKFFRPRWFQPMISPMQWPAAWTSYYDTAPIRELLTKYVDFERLKTSPVRLIFSAVNVETAKLRVFDSYMDDLTVDHLLASGSLPPGFPWVTVDGQHYWDGGIVSNSPLELVVEHCGGASKRIFIVDLFSSKRALPNNLMEVAARREEIIYAEHVQNDVRTRELIQDFRRLVDDLMNCVEPSMQSQVKNSPRYIQLMGDLSKMDVTRIIREGKEQEPLSRDYDFSITSIERNMKDGYNLAKQTLLNRRKIDEGRK